MVQLAQSLTVRSSVEIGQPWQLSTQVADDPVRRAALALDWRRDRPQFQQLLGSRQDLDKILIIVLRSTSQERSVEVWEWDMTSDRWGAVCRQTFLPWQALDHIAFELLASAVSELAVIKSINGDRVVLRPRGALLPLRNLRRERSQVGSVFQLSVGGGAGDDALVSDTFLVVEELEGTRLNCRLVSRYAVELDDSDRDSWIAIGTRSVHAKTDLLVLAADGGPLVGCDVWRASVLSEDAPVVRLGSTDTEGRIAVASEVDCRWLSLQIGDQLLDRVPFLAGRQPSQIWRTRVSDQSLAVAQLFAACNDDLTAWEAQRQVYLARAEARKKAGQQKEAEALLAEMSEALSKESEQLDSRFRSRRKSLLDRFPAASTDVDQRWSTLTDALREK